MQSNFLKSFFCLTFMLLWKHFAHSCFSMYTEIHLRFLLIETSLRLQMGIDFDNSLATEYWSIYNYWGLHTKYINWPQLPKSVNSFLAFQMHFSNANRLFVFKNVKKNQWEKHGNGCSHLKCRGKYQNIESKIMLIPCTVDCDFQLKPFQRICFLIQNSTVK